MTPFGRAIYRDTKQACWYGLIATKHDGTLPQLAKAKKYVETWPDRKANNDGLLLWGGGGTGKTFFAACIANALIEILGPGFAYEEYRNKIM